MSEMYCCGFEGCDFTTEHERGLSIHQSIHTGSSKKTYECPNCGDVFEDYESRRERKSRKEPENVFCDKDCKLDFQTDDIIEVECSWCSLKLEIPEWHHEETENNFCDKECESRWKTVNRVGEGNPRWQGGKVETECENCGDTYKVKLHKTREPRKSKFCSPACTARSQEATEVTLECHWCGRDFERLSREVKDSRPICSDSCLSEWLSDFQRGDGNPAWAGGKAEYYGPDWVEQRRKALERDNFKCQSCGMDETEHRETYSNQLNVHHIIRFKSFDESKEANRLGNLITLCHSCHKTAEKMSEKDQRTMFMSTPETYTHPSTLSGRAV